MQGRKADAKKGLAQTLFSYWLIRGVFSKELVRLVKSLAPQLRDCIFIDCCDKTKERGTLKEGQGRAGFLKIKNPLLASRQASGCKKGGENGRERRSGRKEENEEAKKEAKKKKLKLWTAKTRWNPCFESSKEMVCGHGSRLGFICS